MDQATVLFTTPAEGVAMSEEDASDDRHGLAEWLPDMPIKPGGMESLEERDKFEQVKLVRGFYARDDDKPAAIQVIAMIAVARVVALDLDLEERRWHVVFDAVLDDVPEEYSDHRRPAVPFARDLLAEEAPDMDARFGDRAIVPTSESEAETETARRTPPFD